MKDPGRLGPVNRARITQIMNFNNLAPDIQEESLPPARRARVGSDGRGWAMSGRKGMTT